MRFSKSLIFAAALTVLPVLSQADPVNSNPSLSVGGLSFSGFTCVLTEQGAATPGSCSNIDVSTITSPGSGIKFVSGFSAFGQNSYNDAQIDYHVSSTSGISQVGLFFNGDFYGQAIASVTEAIFDGSTQVGFAKVLCGAGDAGCTQSDEISLNGTYSNLSVQKDIMLAGYSTGGGSSISYVDQTFNDAAPTPEPASFAMLGMGLLGAGLLRRRAKLAAQKGSN